MTDMYEIGGIRFYRQELRDLAIAWIALGLAFTFFLEAPFVEQVRRGALDPGDVAGVFAMSMATVGTGFLLHELAHKVTAVRFGQVAAFRANGPMLAVAVVSGLAGLLVAAPGAVYHRGRITARQNGIVAVAGPVTNLVLAAVFFVPFVLGSGFAGEIGRMGVLINLFLAAFNMIPGGPLDGRTVLNWSKAVFAVVLVTSVVSGAVFLLVFVF